MLFAGFMDTYTLHVQGVRKGSTPTHPLKGFLCTMKGDLFCDAKTFSSSSFIPRKNLDVCSVPLAFDSVITTAFNLKVKRNFFF